MCIVKLYLWICLLFYYLLNTAANLLFDEDFNADEDLTSNPYLHFLPPNICGFGGPRPPLASECCEEPPIFPKDDFRQCLNVTDLKEVDVNILNCTKLSCVFILNGLIDENGYIIYKSFVKYIDHWSQLYPGYERVVTHMKTQCFFRFHSISIYELPCLMIHWYYCYLDKLFEECPFIRDDEECQATAEYKRLCTENHDTDMPDYIE